MVPTRVLLYERARLYAGNSFIIFGACDGTKVTGTARAVPHDILLPVAPRANTLLLVLVWQPLSQQQLPAMQELLPQANSRASAFPYGSSSLPLRPLIAWPGSFSENELEMAFCL